ncbi:hypothetical protein WI80_14335 [Burkholderia ubonensis]|nr:hypothetical protein WI80_14335 [Burkholderia ubonensis]KVU14997.1 hypothetical protein WK63_15415 [Burkholderia ubonensis]KWC20978.1 hypothetical protein WL48_35050 [Burkholderia ubonensis]KWC29941.1 hypothetical protein WL49_29480 [Burkholderia ubonensis]
MNRHLLERVAPHLPGLALLADYRRAWLGRDLYAGVALTTVLVPVGMSYAQAAGLSAVTGLYASNAAPLAGHDPSRAIALAAALALSAGTICVLIGVLGLGFVTDLLSRRRC